MKKITYRSKCFTGFTLIEVLVALLIFMFGFLGILKLQAYIVNSNAFSIQMVNGLSIAQNNLERIQSLPLNPIRTALEDGNHTEGDAQAGIQSSTNKSGINFLSSWICTPLSKDDTKLGTKINMTVSWSHKGSNHSVKLSTIDLQTNE